MNLFEQGDKADADFWQRTVPERFLAVAEQSDRKYDAIILDEAQDFLESYVIGLKELLPDNGYFYVCYDPEQNLYHDRLPGWLEEKNEEALLLPENIRNTREISLASAVLGEFSYADTVSKLGPPGDPVRISTADDPREARDRLRKAFHSTFNEENVQTDRAVVLGYRRYENTMFSDDSELGNFRMVNAKERYENGDPDFSPMEVPYFTIHSDKGLDRDIVFLMNTEAGEKQELDYTGASRARHLLWIITTDPEVERQVREKAPEGVLQANVS